MGDNDPHDPIEVPIDGTLDLHQFAPGDMKTVVIEYLRACRERGMLEVRIVHGKGTGTLRRGVLALLDRLPEVSDYRQGGPGGGEWGAVIVRLRPIKN